MDSAILFPIMQAFSMFIFFWGKASTFIWKVKVPKFISYNISSKSYYFKAIKGPRSMVEDSIFVHPIVKSKFEEAIAHYFNLDLWIVFLDITSNTRHNEMSKNS